MLTKPSQGLLQAFSRRTTRNNPRGAFSEAAGQGLEPDLTGADQPRAPMPLPGSVLPAEAPACSRPYLRQTCDKANRRRDMKEASGGRESSAGNLLIRSQAAFAFALRTRRTRSDRQLEELRVRNASLDSCSARRSLLWRRMNRLFHRVALTVGAAASCTTRRNDRFGSWLRGSNASHRSHKAAPS